MKLTKRRKKSRFRGSKTHRRGFKKKARGSGHRGGFGMSGTGKRGDQKKSMIINLYGNNYFGSDKAIRRPVRKKAPAINIGDIERNLSSYIKQGLAKDNKGSYEINLNNHKILGEGEVEHKLIINALLASQSAIEKVKKAGGNIIVKQKRELTPKAKPESKDNKVVEKK
ncbi:uL15 family ribosomal protein [Candidatus Pacearchaeota archaeon]|nr:uL15 family ribosomal protein [Candidatus Pacearchaeota archaeon]